MKIFGVDRVDVRHFYIQYDINNMTFFELFFFTTIPAGFAFLFLLLSKKKIDEILLKNDNKYITKFNSIGIIRILKTYKNCRSLNNNERKLLILAVIFEFIGLLTIIIWSILILFFPNIIFS